MLELAKQYNKTCIWVYVWRLIIVTQMNYAMIYFGNNINKFIFILPLSLQVLSPFRVMHLFQVFATKSICNPLLKDKTWFCNDSQTSKKCAIKQQYHNGESNLTLQETRNEIRKCNWKYILLYYHQSYPYSYDEIVSHCVLTWW